MFISVVHGIFQNLGVSVDVNRYLSNGLKFRIQMVSFCCMKGNIYGIQMVTLDPYVVLVGTTRRSILHHETKSSMPNSPVWCIVQYIDDNQNGSFTYFDYFHFILDKNVTVGQGNYV